MAAKHAAHSLLERLHAAAGMQEHAGDNQGFDLRGVLLAEEPGKVRAKRFKQLWLGFRHRVEPAVNVLVYGVSRTLDPTFERSDISGREPGSPTYPIRRVAGSLAPFGDLVRT
jgi:hypothetical protein